MEKSRIAEKQLAELMSKHRDFGAVDSEGWQAVRQVEEAADAGERFPFNYRNPFQLYESVHGWQTASAELVAAAEVYWRALVAEKLGITVAEEADSEKLDRLRDYLNTSEFNADSLDDIWQIIGR